jgi:hypothetical protein
MAPTPRDRLDLSSGSLLHRIHYRLSGDTVSLQKSRRLQQYFRMDDDGRADTRLRQNP